MDHTNVIWLRKTHPLFCILWFLAHGRFMSASNRICAPRASSIPNEQGPLHSRKASDKQGLWTASSFNTIQLKSHNNVIKPSITLNTTNAYLCPLDSWQSRSLSWQVRRAWATKDKLSPWDVNVPWAPIEQALSPSPCARHLIVTWQLILATSWNRWLGATHSTSSFLSGNDGVLNSLG